MHLASLFDGLAAAIAVGCSPADHASSTYLSLLLLQVQLERHRFDLIVLHIAGHCKPMLFELIPTSTHLPLFCIHNFQQVERELAVRGALTKPPRNLARLVAAGTVVNLDCSRRVSSSSVDTVDGRNNGSDGPPHSSNAGSSSSPVASNQGPNNTLQFADSSSCALGLVGRRMLVLERAGVPLVQGGVLPILALPEALHLLTCLLTLVVDLLVSWPVITDECIRLLVQWL